MSLFHTSIILAFIKFDIEVYFVFRASSFGFGLRAKPALSSTLGKYDGEGFIDNRMTAFGETLSGSEGSAPAEALRFFTGKPEVEGLGYAFLFRSYRPELGKWQTSDPVGFALLEPEFRGENISDEYELGYPDGWNNLAYVNNKVMSYIDWQGTVPILISSGNIATGENSWSQPETGYDTKELLIMKQCIVNLFITAVVLSLLATESLGSQLIPYRKGEMWGYSDKYGTMVIPCRYMAVEPFSDGIAMVRESRKGKILRGYLTTSGSAMANSDFDDSRSFREGMAAFKAGNKWGFIGSDLKPIIKPEYDSAGDFHGGLASVKLGNAYGFINDRGKQIIPFIYQDAKNVSEGLAAVAKDDNWGFIDKTGKG